MIKSPILKSPEKIVIYTIPEIGNKVKPYLEVVSGKDFSVVCFLLMSFKISLNFYRYGQIKAV
jgi:hypothetical protein